MFKFLLPNQSENDISSASTHSILERSFILVSFSFPEAFRTRVIACTVCVAILLLVGIATIWVHLVTSLSWDSWSGGPLRCCRLTHHHILLHLYHHFFHHVHLGFHRKNSGGILCQCWCCTVGTYQIGKWWSCCINIWCLHVVRKTWSCSIGWSMI